MSLYQSAVKKPITTALIFVAVAIFGLFSLINIPIDLIPEIETNTIMVMTSYQGANASDIENNVTKPLENVLNSCEDLKHITSQSKENIKTHSLAPCLLGYMCISSDSRSRGLGKSRTHSWGMELPPDAATNNSLHCNFSISLSEKIRCAKRFA